MAVALECPTCHTRHSLDDLDPSVRRFACTGCDRSLKVPTTLAGSNVEPAEWATGQPAPAERATGQPEPGRSHVGAPESQSEDLDPLSQPLWRLAWYARLLLWIVSLPVGFAIVAVPARMADILQASKLLDAFLSMDVQEFIGPLAVVIPAWAIVTGTLVHIGALGIEARSRRKLERAENMNA